MRRLITSVSFAYLLVAFGFILLTMLNATRDDNLLVMAWADARVVAVMAALGILVTIVLGVRVLIDGKRRQDLERMVNEPRRKSQAPPHRS